MAFTKSEWPLYLLCALLLSLSQLQMSLSQHPANTILPPWPPIATDVTGAVGPLYTVFVSRFFKLVSTVLEIQQTMIFVPTSRLSFRTHPALSAMYMHADENGSWITSRILDCRTIGLPFLLPDFAALRARVDSEASDWKKWPGSVDRDIIAVLNEQKLDSAGYFFVFARSTQNRQGVSRRVKVASPIQHAFPSVFIDTSLGILLPLNRSNMATTTQMRLRGRPAHTAGPTYLSYTPDGTKLITVGSNNTARVYKTGYDGEPTNIDDVQEQNMGVDSTVSLLLHFRN